MPKAIIVMGPPGAGKGTQAQFIVDYIDGVLYDTGSKIRERLAKGEFLHEDYSLEANAAGKLLDPKATLAMVTKDTKEIRDSGKSVIFSGSPRSIMEAFGENDDGLMHMLSDTYGKENIIMFHLHITLEEAIKRNSEREDGARADDTPETIKVRYEEQYGKSVAPTIVEIQNRGYNVIDIDGMPSREEVFESIKKHL